MQAAMAKKKRHSRVEITTKLAQANDLAAQGKLQSEIARTLGVSVMTLYGGASSRHWWRSPGRESLIARAAPTTELPNSSSKIHGCGAW
jgi:hypothetical protein